MYIVVVREFMWVVLGGVKMSRLCEFSAVEAVGVEDECVHVYRLVSVKM